MPNRKTRPTSPGRRFGTYPMREELTGAEPNKGLTKGKSSSGGRNSKGRVTARHRGGGAKRRYRQIDFKRTKDGIPARVASIEYDPNRSASIALLNYADGEKRYILAPQGLRVGGRGRLRRGRRHRPGQLALPRPHPDRHRGPQRRADPRPGRQARPLGGHRDPGGREGGPDGQPSAALVGGADGPRRVPRDRRHALERRAPEREDRQGRSQPPQGQAARRRAASP